MGDNRITMGAKVNDGDLCSLEPSDLDESSVHMTVYVTLAVYTGRLLRAWSWEGIHDEPFLGQR